MPHGLFNPFFTGNYANPYYYSAGEAEVSYFVLAVAGDSNKDGRGDAVDRPVVPAGTLYNWNGSGLDEITTESVSNDGDYGGLFQQFAIKLKALTGRPTVLVNGAKGGAYVTSTPGSTPPNSDWSETGILYSPFKTSLNAALSFLGRSVPDAIVFGDAVNDVRNAVSAATISTAFDNLISRFHTDWPDAPVVLTQIGYDGTNGLTQTLYDIRKYVIDKSYSDSLVHVVSTPASFNPSGANMYDVDLLHYTQAGYNTQGEMIARWAHLTQYNKTSRCVIASLMDDLTEARMALIDRIIDGIDSRGDFQLLENLSLFFTSDVNNAFVDLSLMGFNAVSGVSPTFTANSHAAFNGSTNAMAMGVTQSFTRRATQNDVFEGAFLLTNTGANCNVFGVVNGTTNDHALIQGVTDIIYTVNDSTNTLAETTPLSVPQFHGIYRNAGTKGKYTGKVSTDTAAQASTGRATAINKLGCGGGSSNSGFYGGNIAWYIASSNVGFDFATLYDDVEYARAHWND